MNWLLPETTYSDGTNSAVWSNMNMEFSFYLSFSISFKAAATSVVTFGRYSQTVRVSEPLNSSCSWIVRASLMTYYACLTEGGLLVTPPPPLPLMIIAVCVIVAMSLHTSLAS